MNSIGDVFEPMVESGYEWINCADPTDYEVFSSFDGSARRAQWEPVPVVRVRADDKHQSTPSDFPWLGSDALVLRRTAVDALRDMLDANGELLPLATDDGVELVVFNARVIDALDVSNSTLVMFPGTQRVLRVKKVAFVASAIEGSDLFRLPHRASSTYVSSRFVDRVRQASLRGLIFNRVW